MSRPAARVAIQSSRIEVALAPPSTRLPSDERQEAATAGWAVDAYVASSRDSWMTVAGDVRPSGVVVTSRLSHGSSGQPASTQ